MNAAAWVREKTQGRGADVVFNTTVNPQIAQQALACTAFGGV